MRVTPGAVGKITLNWIPKFNPHTFFSSTGGDADNLRLLEEARLTKRMYEQFAENVPLILNAGPETHLHRCFAPHIITKFQA
jgi:hypothetical protein